jgi:DNA-binding response OmpR family regulator
MKALVVEDDPTLADVIAFTLRREGFHVIQALDGEMALQRWTDEDPDIIFLDINLPKLDGFSVCEKIRERSNTPIIMLTVRGEEEDILRGLDIGADDYITKPFSPRQLTARARAVLRRMDRIQIPSTYNIGDLKFDQDRREVQVGGKSPVQLTQLESKLLEILIRNSGHVLTINQIIEYVWGAEGADRDMLRQVVHRLRGKIEPDPTNPSYIETVPGIGYGLTLPSSQ